jgi:hypothetical protein
MNDDSQKAFDEAAAGSGSAASAGATPPATPGTRQSTQAKHVPPATATEVTGAAQARYLTEERVRPAPRFTERLLRR